MFDKLIEKVKAEPKKIVFTEGPDARIQETFESIMMRTFLFYYSLLGREGFEQRCNAMLRSLFENTDQAYRKRIAFNCKLNELSISKNLPKFEDLNASGILIKDGAYYFRL